jgi:uncharacterized membrane protein
MLFIIYALLASIAYSTDVIFGKLALDNMNIIIFTFFIGLCYTFLSFIIYIFNYNKINSYLINKNNYYYIFYAIIAIFIGTIFADICMWYAINNSSKKLLPITVSIIHTVPVFSLLLVYFIFKESLNYKQIFGILLTIIGVIITVYFT